MCTVTWLRTEEDYHLLFNRDERRSRAVATEPRRQQIDGVEVIAPADGYYGGAWIASNEFGVSCALLNGALQTGDVESKQKPRSIFRSRGLFLMTLATSSDVGEALQRFTSAELHAYSAFTAIVMEPGQPAAILEWNGEERIALPFGDPFMPLASSSFDGEGVSRARRFQFRELVRQPAYDIDTLIAFHRSHNGEPNAYSTCMHRADAETVSFSWITVTESQVLFRYSPVCPCWQGPTEITCLPRR